MNGKPLLICYDGSDDAKRAIAAAGELFASRPALVLSVWQPVVAAGAYGFAGMAILTDMSDVDAEAQRATTQLAADGAQLARDAGLDAQPLVVEASGPIWRTILDTASDRDAAAIAMGSRGLSGIKSVLLGSVSSYVVHHAGRPTLVVPHV